MLIAARITDDQAVGHMALRHPPKPGLSSPARNVFIDWPRKSSCLSTNVLFPDLSKKGFLFLVRLVLHSKFQEILALVRGPIRR
jgi:hypothetical protein